MLLALFPPEYFSGFEFLLTKHFYGEFANGYIRGRLFRTFSLVPYNFVLAAHITIL